MEGIRFLDWFIPGCWGVVRFGQPTRNGGVSGNSDTTAIVSTGCCVSYCMDVVVPADGDRCGTNLGSQAFGAAKPGDQFVYFTADREFLLEFDLF